jgi:hypothetical protein
MRVIGGQALENLDAVVCMQLVLSSPADAFEASYVEAVAVKGNWVRCLA